MVKQHFASEFEKMPLLNDHSENSRGYGVSDMADCLICGRRNLRASGRLALHVLEIMHAIHTSSGTERFIRLTTSCERPEPLPLSN